MIKLINLYVHYQILISLKAGSQYDGSLALHPLGCDKILKTDWSQTQCITLCLIALKEAHHLHNTTHLHNAKKHKALCHIVNHS